MAKKSWIEKFQVKKTHEITSSETKFADIPANSKILIATPQIVNEYIRQIPAGSSVNTATIRKDLAAEYQADYTCPVTTGIFLRLVAEAAYEQLINGTSAEHITPFWRAIEPNSPLAKKLTFGQDFLLQQRKKEGIEEPVKKGRSRITSKV